jgi:hypothetical protein
MTTDAQTDDVFQAWAAPATKGDVIRALISARGMNLAIYQALVAIETKNQEGLTKALDRFDTAWEDSNRLIDELGEYEAGGGVDSE